MHVVARTERLILRRFDESDGDNLWTLYSDPEVMKFIQLPTISRAELDEREFPNILSEYEKYDDFGIWALETTSGEFLGRMGLHPAVPEGVLWRHGSPEETSMISLGYRLRRSAWGQGYATEGGRALVAKAFGELGASRLCATTMAVNTGSRRVLEKLGFRHVDTVHLDFPDPLPGTEHGEVIYRLEKRPDPRPS